MLVIGLTGGIGSGKSTVANYFQALGIEVIDTDLIARQGLSPQTKAHEMVITHFGSSILDSKNTIDRKKLREMVFKNPREKEWLEKLIHPLIREEVLKQIQQVRSVYCLVVIPLLIETLPHDYLDRILVVDCPENLQIERAIVRDQNSEELIKAIMSQQASREQRLSMAHDVIVNDQDEMYLKQQVADLDKKYRNLCSLD